MLWPGRILIDFWQGVNDHLSPGCTSAANATVICRFAAALQVGTGVGQMERLMHSVVKLVWCSYEDSDLAGFVDRGCNI